MKKVVFRFEREIFSPEKNPKLKKKNVYFKDYSRILLQNLKLLKKYSSLRK